MTNDQITHLLQDLVRIPSVNPHGDPGTEKNNTGEQQIAEFIAEFLRKLGFDVEYQKVMPGRPNVIGKFSSRHAKQSIALAPHTDTVSVAGMTIDPFGGDVREGKLYGRGASDTKGPMASALAALANVTRDKRFREGNLDIYFCALMGEESGNDGARAMLDSGFKTDFAIASEPTDCRTVHTHKGALWFRIITRGKSVHGSMPERGESAILKMAEVIQYVLGDYTSRLKESPDTTLGAPTVNIGVVQGGAQTNIVPNYCSIDVDRRTVPSENHEAVMADLREHLKHLPIETEVIRNCHPLNTSATNPFVRQLAQSIAVEKNIKPEEAVMGAPWFCDAGIFAEHSIPAVAFGPGSIAQAHVADEFIELDQVHQATKIMERFLLSCSEQKSL